VSQTLLSERNMRESMGQGFECQVQGVRDALEADRTSRRTETVTTVSLIEESRQSILEEIRARESFEDTHTLDILQISERIEAVIRSQHEQVQDIFAEVKTVAGRCNKRGHDNNRLALQVRQEGEGSHAEASRRLLNLEERAQALEGHTVEEKAWQAGNFDRLNEKHEKLLQALEQLRLSDKARGLQIENMIRGVNEIQDVVKASELELREEAERDKHNRQQEFRGYTQSMLAKQNKLHADIEDKVSVRLERESVLRASMCQQVMEDVSAALPDPGSTAVVPFAAGSATAPTSSPTQLRERSFSAPMMIARANAANSPTRSPMRGSVAMFPAASVKSGSPFVLTPQSVSLVVPGASPVNVGQLAPPSPVMCGSRTPTSPNNVGSSVTTMASVTRATFPSIGQQPMIPVASQGYR